jgi:hypothetical protein
MLVNSSAIERHSYRFGKTRKVLGESPRDRENTGTGILYELTT